MATITSKVYVHGGDYDCSEAVRMCYRAIDILPYGSYMWTGNEVQLLKENGFSEVNLTLSNLKRGDVLWKSGHTEMYLGDGLQGGARIDEVGGVTGPKQGDQTGKEICSSKFDQSYWKWQKALRYFGSITSNGIPAGEAAAQVMEHLINHNLAHGYSQTNRAGDGTIEAITLKWEKNETPVVVVKPTTPTGLTIDGWLGKQSVTAWQKQLSKYADGVISGQAASLRSYYPNLLSVEFDGGGGSLTVIAIQRKLNVAADGVLGPTTIRAIQRKIGVSADGILGYQTACAIQQSINSGAWR